MSVANVLVDSSFYINRMRQRQDPFHALRETSDRYDVYSCGVVKTEVCRGITAQRLYQNAVASFEVMCWVSTTDEIWDDTLALAWKLARKGITMQVTDMLIAVCALAVDAAVLTLDSDFDHVPGLHVIHELR